MQTFMTCYLLEQTLNGCIREFYIFTISLFSLIAKQFCYISIDLTVKLNDIETVNRSYIS